MRRPPTKNRILNEFESKKLRLKRVGEPVAPEDLVEHQCLGYFHYAAGAEWLPRDGASGEARMIHVALPIECDNDDALCELAALGEGVVLLPRFIVATQLEMGRLAHLSPQREPPEIWLDALRPPHESLLAKVNTFTKFIEQIITADPSMLTGSRYSIE